MPPASEFDKDRYRKEVLEPALKRGNAPPPDLMIRYAAAGLERNADAFKARIDEVVRYWRELEQKLVYKQLAAALLAAHARLKDAGQVSYAHFAQQRDAERDEALARLKATVSDIAATTPAVLRSTLTWLRDLYSGMFSDDAIKSEFAARQVAVVDQGWPLPPRPSQLSGLARSLDTLDIRLAAEAVFSTGDVRAGFRLKDGFRLIAGNRVITRDLIAGKKEKLALRPHDGRKTAHEDVLQALQQSEERHELNALLLWQLIDVLQPQVTEGLPNRSVITLASSLGLDRAEAAELVLTLVQRRSEGSGAHAAGLKRIDDAEQAGDTEEAAALLTELISKRGDGGGRLHARLSALPPPPPVRVLATQRGSAVYVQWQPGPTRADQVQYRAVRSAGAPAASPSAGLVVADTDALNSTDGEPPNGMPLYYTVFGTRGADIWSAGTSAPVVVLLPEVTACQLEVQDDAILGSWRVAAGTADVLVTRAEGSPPPETGGQQIATSLAGFHDTGLRAGTRYYYRIRAVYVSDAGERRVTPGIVCWATPETALEMVREFRAELLPADEPGVMLSWRAPEAGTVRIYRGDSPPPRPPGAVIRLDELAGYGRPVPGRVVDDDGGESRLRTRLVNGRSCFTAMTVGAERAVVGETATMMIMSPVSDLQARRDGEKVWLRWTWAEGCHVCRVEWPGGPGQPAAAAECGRRRFHDDGGFEIVSGSQPLTVSVRSVYRDADGEITSVPAQVEVPGRDVTVRYAFLHKAWWAPWRRDRLILRTDRECTLPPLTVVYKAGRIMPLRAEQGTPVAELPGADLSPDRPLSVPVPAPARRGPGWLVCFFSGDPPDGISLVPTESRR
jgi:hypothetical protein